jgi:type IV pilus assembly protein PilA
VKTPLLEWIADKGTIPPGVTSMGGTSTGKYVNSITISSNGGTALTPEIVAVFKTSGVNAKITGATFAMSSTDGGKTWDCGAGSSTDVPTSLLPGACK